MLFHQICKYIHIYIHICIHAHTLMHYAISANPVPMCMCVADAIAALRHSINPSTF